MRRAKVLQRVCGQARSLALLGLCMALGLSVQGQRRVLSTPSKRAAKLYQEGLQAYRLGQNAAAIGSLLKAQEHDGAFVESYLLLAQIYGEANDYPRALQANLRALAIDSMLYPRAFLDAAHMAFMSQQYSACLSLAARYMRNDSSDAQRHRLARSLRASCAYSAYAVAHPQPVNPEPVPGGVNTRLDEYFPSISADGLTLSFTRYLPFEGQARSARGQEDMHLARRGATHEAWGVASSLGAPVDTRMNEGAQSMAAAANGMYFTRCDGPCNIYYTELQPGGRWSEPRLLPPAVNARGYSDKQPCISPDGRRLYFVSNRPGGHGGYDLWCSARSEEGEWLPAVNLGPMINTEGHEQTPFIHFDNATLFFSSSGHPGLGDLDLFRSVRGASDTVWSPPQNLGYPINTFGADMGMVVSADGRTAYYSSDRDERMGLDIYAFELPDTVRPQASSYLRGQVVDAGTGAPLSASCQLVDLASGQEVMRVRTDALGSFLVCLPVGRRYGLFASSSGYLDASLHFDLVAQREAGAPPQEETIGLHPMRVGTAITMRNVFFETDSDTLSADSHVELDRWVALLARYPALRIRIVGHTDNQGSAAYNLGLSRRRAASVVAYLRGQGVAAQRMESEGLGLSQPAASNATEAGRAENRRTECVVLSL